jgi:hypothetical protein
LAAHRPKIRKSEHAVAAIVSLDPAAVGDCGLAARTTVGLRYAKYSSLQLPSFTFSGWVFEPRMHDELAVWLADHIGANQRALLVVENAAYRGAARHLGRAIGCIESILHDLNVADPRTTQYVTPGAWRAGVFGHPLPKGRDALKQRAIDDVEIRYRSTVSSDLAEAICLNDYFVMAKRKVWSGGEKLPALAPLDEVA